MGKKKNTNKSLCTKMLTSDTDSDSNSKNKEEIDQITEDEVVLDYELQVEEDTNQGLELMINKDLNQNLEFKVEENLNQDLELQVKEDLELKVEEITSNIIIEELSIEQKVLELTKLLEEKNKELEDVKYELESTKKELELNRTKFNSMNTIDLLLRLKNNFKNNSDNLVNNYNRLNYLKIIQ